MKMSRQELRKLADFREMAEAHVERLGRAIMRRRKALGWSRAKLGRETNAHEKTVERWEKAQTAGALDNLEAIAEAFDTDPDDLLAEAMVRQHGGPVPDLLGALSGGDLRALKGQLDRMERTLNRILDAVGGEAEEITEEAEEIALGADVQEQPPPPETVPRKGGEAERRRAAG